MTNATARIFQLLDYPKHYFSTKDISLKGLSSVSTSVWNISITNSDKQDFFFFFFFYRNLAAFFPLNSAKFYKYKSVTVNHCDLKRTDEMITISIQTNHRLCPSWNSPDKLL